MRSRIREHILVVELHEYRIWLALKHRIGASVVTVKCNRYRQIQHPNVSLCPSHLGCSGCIPVTEHGNRSHDADALSKLGAILQCKADRDVCDRDPPHKRVLGVMKSLGNVGVTGHRTPHGSPQRVVREQFCNTARSGLSVAVVSGGGRVRGYHDSTRRGGRCPST